MDKIIFSLLRTVWGRSVLWFVLGSFAAAAAWLAYENKSLSDKRAQCEQQAAETERRCADEIDRIRREQIEHLRDLLKRQEAAEKKRKR